MKESLEFYNQLDKKLIRDFVLGNKRIVNAITHLGCFIPKHSLHILDIGCGLGWSSFEFASHFYKARVDGVDLSPVLIKTATKLFDDKSNLFFSNYDLTQDLPKNAYDAIIMIDVYEHIPKIARIQFHKSLEKILNKKGRLLLSCPSKYHQDFLRKNKPEGLQPIDEYVDFNSIQQLAKDIKGDIIYFEYQKIWDHNDYFYAVIEIEPWYGKSSALLKGNLLAVEAPNLRRKRVYQKLGIKFPKQKRTNSLQSLVSRIKRKLT